MNLLAALSSKLVRRSRTSRLRLPRDFLSSWRTKNMCCIFGTTAYPAAAKRGAALSSNDGVGMTLTHCESGRAEVLLVSSLCQKALGAKTRVERGGQFPIGGRFSITVNKKPSLDLSVILVIKVKKLQPQPHHFLLLCEKCSMSSTPETEPGEPRAPTSREHAGDIPQHSLKSAGQVAVRDAVEAIYSGTLTASVASKSCEASCASLEKWVRDLPPGLRNDANSLSLRRATNSMFSIKDGRETPWHNEEMREALQDVICGRKSVRGTARATMLRKSPGLKGGSLHSHSKPCSLHHSPRPR